MRESGQAGALLIMLALGIAIGLMAQRFNRSRRDLKAAKVFARSASRLHWRTTVPRMLLWGFLAVCAVIAMVRTAG